MLSICPMLFPLSIYLKSSIFCREGRVIIGPVEFGLNSDLVVYMNA